MWRSSSLALLLLGSASPFVVTEDVSLLERQQRLVRDLLVSGEM